MTLLKMKIHLVTSLILVLILSSCKTQRMFYDESNSDVSFIVHKENFEIPEDPFESPIYKFSFFLDSKEDRKKFEMVSLEVITQDNKFWFQDKMDFEQEITSVSEVINQKTRVPFFLVENKDHQFKYFFNFRQFKNPVEKEIYNNPVSVLAPVRRIKFVFSPRVKNHIALKKNEKYSLGEVDIYQYDLKITPSDQMVRLHYVSKDNIISSNWIDISEESDQLNKLFEY